MSDIVKNVGNEVGAFTKEFTELYIQSLVTESLTGILSKITETGDPEEDPEEDSKSDTSIVASGIALVGQHRGYSPDRVWRTFYDFGGYAIRPKNSNISRCVKRYSDQRHLIGKVKVIKNNKNLTSFPGKSPFASHDSKFYRERMTNLINYWRSVNVQNDICTNKEFLLSFDLLVDEEVEDRKDIFFDCLKDMAKDKNINWMWTLERAQRLGVDRSMREMMKVVLIAYLSPGNSSKIHQYFNDKVGFAPDFVRSYLISSTDKQLNLGIAKAVDSSWLALETSFNQASKQIQKVLDSQSDKIAEILKKIVEPVMNLVKKKKSKGDDDEKDTSDNEDNTNNNDTEETNDNINGNEEPGNETNETEETKDNEPGSEENTNKIKEENKKKKKKKEPKVNLDRFPAIKQMYTDLKQDNVKLSEILKYVTNSCEQLRYTWKYIKFIRYPLSDYRELSRFIPGVHSMFHKHERLTMCLLQISRALTIGFCKAFVPLVGYLDGMISGNVELDDNFDSNMRKNVGLAGRSLSFTYYNIIPYINHASWACGYKTTRNIIKWAQQTINGCGDIFGIIYEDLKPKSKDEILPQFVNILNTKLREFIIDRCYTLTKLVRKETNTMLIQFLSDSLENDFDKMVSKLEDLISKLPPPLNKIPIKQLLNIIFEMLIEKTVELMVTKIAKPSETMFLNPDDKEEIKLKEVNENEMDKYRVEITIRTEDDVNTTMDLSNEPKDGEQPAKE